MKFKLYIFIIPYPKNSPSFVFVVSFLVLCMCLCDKKEWPFRKLGFISSLMYNLFRILSISQRSVC